MLKHVDRWLGMRLLNCPIGIYPALRGLNWYWRKFKNPHNAFFIDGYAEYKNCVKRDRQFNKFMEIFDDKEHSKFSYYLSNKFADRKSILFKSLPETQKEFVEILSKRVLSQHKINSFRPLDVSLMVTRGMKVWDKEAEQILSSDWHFDRRYLNLLRIFILANDVDVSDGPFEYLDRHKTLQNIKKLGWRRGLWANTEPNGSRKFIGNFGDGLLINTQLLAHRATLPEEGKERKMLQIVVAV